MGATASEKQGQAKALNGANLITGMFLDRPISPSSFRIQRGAKGSTLVFPAKCGDPSTVTWKVKKSVLAKYAFLQAFRS